MPETIPVVTSAAFLPDPSFPFAIWRNTRHDAIDLHAHEFVELVIVRGGHGIHFSSDEEYPIGAGDVFVIHRDQSHGYRATRGLDLVNILFKPDQMLAERDGIGGLPGYQALFSFEPNYRKQHRFSSHLRLDADHLHRMNDLVDAMIREIRVQAPGYRFLVTGLFMQVVVTLSRLYSDTLHPPVVALLELERLLNEVAAHLDEELCLSELARRAGMSPSTLLRRFRTATGYAPMEYLFHLRLDRARELLASTNRRVTEIAFETGFRDSNYFARRFRQHTGVSPRQYRKAVRQR